MMLRFKNSSLLAVTPVIVLLLSILAISCKSPCSDPGMVMVFERFDSTALSIIVVEKYERGTNFLIRRQRIVAGTAFTAPFNGDTIDIRTSGTYSAIATDMDTRVTLPIAGKEFTIRDISTTEERASQTSDRCSNTVHYYLDDISYSAKGYAFDGRVDPVKVVLKP